MLPLRKKVPGFTLIELLVVVAIIALLISILLPSLARAREQAKLAKCVVNLHNITLAVITFSNDHKGYAQLIGLQDEWDWLDSTKQKYSYGPDGSTRTLIGSGGGGRPRGGGGGGSSPGTIPPNANYNRQILNPWPVAYGPYLGATVLKAWGDYSERGTGGSREVGYYWNKFGRFKQFECPSDKHYVNNTWAPFANLSVHSYAINEDVFGATNPNSGEGQPWRGGGSGDVGNYAGARARRMEGKLELVVRPAEVVSFCDGNDDVSKFGVPHLLLTNGNPPGPYLADYERHFNRLGHRRHSGSSGRPGLSIGFVDGHAQYHPATEFERTSGGTGTSKRPIRYLRRPRVTPYDSWSPGAASGGGGRGQR